MILEFLFYKILLYFLIVCGILIRVCEYLVGFLNIGDLRWFDREFLLFFFLVCLLMLNSLGNNRLCLMLLNVYWDYIFGKFLIKWLKCVVL